MVNGVLVSGGKLYGYVNGKRVNLYTFEEAMKRLGVSKPTFYDWVKKGKIKQILYDTGVKGQPKIRCVSDPEIERIKELMKGGWVRGKGGRK